MEGFLAREKILSNASASKGDVACTVIACKLPRWDVRPYLL